MARVPHPRLPTLDDDPGPTCQIVRGGVTDTEVAVLAEMRALKREVAAVKDALATASPEESVTQNQRLDDLRQRWSGLVERREAARRERMILLGYDPD